MSYAGFPNVAAPSFWGPLSGRANRTDTSDPPQPIVATLNSMWDGTKYFRPYDDADPGVGVYWLNARFAPAAPTLVSTLYVDSAAGGDSLAILAWDENGGLLSGGWTGMWDTLFPVENLGDFAPGNPRRIWQFDFPAPTLVSRLEFWGWGGYPQGNPIAIFGIYGLNLSAPEPPGPPPSFWTDLLKSEQEPL